MNTKDQALKEWQAANPRHQQGVLMALLKHSASFGPLAKDCDRLGLDDLGHSAKSAADTAVVAAALLRELAKGGEP